MADPTYSELAELVAAQALTIQRLETRIVDMAAEIVELKRRLGTNSRNSSKPPSTDGLDRSPARKEQRRAGRKPGKQPGAQGFALRPTDTPDLTIDHLPAACGGCGEGLSDATTAGVMTRQVTDIPTVTATTTEHRLHQLRCRCGHVTTAAAPAGAARPVQYGPNIKALACYLLVYQHIPVERAQTLIADVTGVRPSTGWISSVVTQVADVLTDSTDTVKTHLKAAPVVHVDETTIKVSGVKWWLHVASTTTLTAYHLHRSRGRAAVDEFGVLAGYTGTVVHDGLSVYDGDAYKTARHAWCGAHILRELTAAAETHPTQVWPAAAKDAYLALNTAAHRTRTAGRTAIITADLVRLTGNFDQAILVGLSQNPRREGTAQSKTRNLLQRLHGDERVLLFARDLQVPFTNNQGERDIRPTKTQGKISGSHRSEIGAKAWLTVRGHISTLRKHRLNTLDGIRNTILGNPWKPAFS